MKFRPSPHQDRSQLIVASSPFTHNQKNTAQLMRYVILAAVPGIAVQAYFFGYGNLMQIMIAMITAILAEALVLILRKQALAPRLGDYSALLTALLLGVSLPPLAPWWMVMIGTAFAIIIAKQLYGGLGHNPFNPAMIGYVVLLIAFPVQMTSWLPSAELQQVTLTFSDTLQMIFTGHLSADTLSALHGSYDGISQATPLDSFKTGLRSGQSADLLKSQPVLSGVLAGLGWQWVNLAFLCGGVIMLILRVIQWHIPLSMLLSLTLCSALAWAFSPQDSLSPLMQLFSGATMLGAFFIATDPVTASTTPKGRLIYGAMIGVLVWLIRVHGGYPDGVAFAVLLANITVPLIDHFTQPRVYGHR